MVLKMRMRRGQDKFINDSLDWLAMIVVCVGSSSDDDDDDDDDDDILPKSLAGRLYNSWTRSSEAVRQQPSGLKLLRKWVSC